MKVTRWIAVITAVLWVVTSYAQLPSVTTAPTQITFAPWHEVDRTDDGIEYSASFPSPIQSGYTNNDTVPLKILVPTTESGPFPVVLILHYWGARDLRAELSLAADLNRKGIAAVIMTLPFHLGRTPVGSRSGELAIQPDPQKLRQTMTQSALDARRTVDFIASHGEFDSNRIGLVGTSLGGVVGSLVYSVEPRITKAAFVLGGVDLAKILWTSSRVVTQRDMMRRNGMTEESLRKDLVSVEPLTYLPRKDLTSTFVVGAKFDTVMPMSATTSLISELHEPAVLWLNTGHYGGILAQGRLLGEIANFFGKVFCGTHYTPPVKLYTPTIRLGALTMLPTGIDLGAGLDLWRFNPSGTSFASIFVTPRGPQIFAGSEVSKGLAVGISVSSRGGAIGILWSTVL